MPERCHLAVVFPLLLAILMVGVPGPLQRPTAPALSPSSHPREAADARTISAAGAVRMLSPFLVAPKRAIDQKGGISGAPPEAGPVLAETGEELTTYTDAGGGWTIQYPADLWYPERLDDDVIIFISDDRTSFVAVDSYDEVASRYGNTGENLRNRARDTLAMIYGRPVEETGIVWPAPDGWQTGVTFATDRGSEGEAVYRQPLEVQPAFRVYGVLYGFKSYDADAILPLALAARASFTQLE